MLLFVCSVLVQNMDCCVLCLCLLLRVFVNLVFNVSDFLYGGCLLVCFCVFDVVLCLPRSFFFCLRVGLLSVLCVILVVCVFW